MFSSIKNLILIGLGINKMALEAVSEFLSHKIQDKTANKEMAEDFLGTSIKRPDSARDKKSPMPKSKKVIIE